MSVETGARPKSAPSMTTPGRLPGEILRFGVPKGSWSEEPTQKFLESCGLKVERENDRQLTAEIAGQPGVTVVLQRARDILKQVEDGRVDVGIGFLNVWREHGLDGDALVMLDGDLGYSYGRIAVAVPDSWVDVSTLADLSDVAAAMRERGEELRVATSYPNLTRRFFYEKGITHFAIVPTEGGVEAAPAVGFADIIVDYVSTGTTLKGNRLKVLRNGIILRSQACLIGNRRALAASREKREIVRRMLELIEARQRAQGFYSVTANLLGSSEADVARSLLVSPATRGMSGPTVARVYTGESVGLPSTTSTGNGQNGGVAPAACFAATIIVGADALQEAVDHLRAAGGSGISVVPVRYLFDERSRKYDAMLAELGLRDG
ncbi:MAG: ATP phosphoribosyltransferase [Chloroflexi bacterium]|nr:ATP phosphoribosyltransferase [Chloroflexota bacterium]